MSERGTPRASYTAGFKLRVVSYAVDHGNRAAGKKFSVDERCFRKWQAQREKLTNTQKMKRGNRHGVAQVGLDPAAYEMMFGSCDDEEDFYGF